MAGYDRALYQMYLSKIPMFSSCTTDQLDTIAQLGEAVSTVDGHDVQIAHDGPMALQMATTFQPDVILLDIGLPGIDGYEVAERLRGQDEFRETRIIAMTGYGQPDDRRRSKEAGIDYHLVKPVKIDVVRSLLARENSADLGIVASTSVAGAATMNPSLSG